MRCLVGGKTCLCLVSMLLRQIRIICPPPPRHWIVVPLYHQISSMCRPATVDTLDNCSVAPPRHNLSHRQLFLGRSYHLAIKKAIPCSAAEVEPIRSRARHVLTRERSVMAPLIFEAIVLVMSGPVSRPHEGHYVMLAILERDIYIRYIRERSSTSTSRNCFMSFRTITI